MSDRYDRRETTRAATIAQLQRALNVCQRSINALEASGCSATGLYAEKRRLVAEIRAGGTPAMLTKEADGYAWSRAR